MLERSTTICPLATVKVEITLLATGSMTWLGVALLRTADGVRQLQAGGPGPYPIFWTQAVMPASRSASAASSEG